MADIDFNKTLQSAMNDIHGRTMLDQAKNEYPILRSLNMGFKMNPQPNRGVLEFWPGDEAGTPERPRPNEFPLGQIGVEVYDKRARPIDIMGDIASHHLIYTDPKMQDYYKQFKQTFTDEQKARLQSQYEWAKQNESETRPFDQWAEHSGMPGYFRGYAFQQWPEAESAYTADQLKMFNEMMSYLKGNQ